MDLFVPIGAVAGFLAGYLGRAQQTLRPSQSRIAWVPALIADRSWRELGWLVVWSVGGTAIGATLGAGLLLSLEARG